MKNKELKASLILLLTAAIWGFAMAEQREGSRFLEPLTFNACRSTVGALALLPLMLRSNRKTKHRVTRRDVLAGIAVGLVMFVAQFLQQSGVTEVDAGKAGFLTALYVVLVPVLGIFLKRRTGLTTWLALLLALPALYFLCMQEGEGFTLVPGDTMLLLGAVLWAAHILLTDHFVVDVPVLVLCVVQFITVAVFSWGGALARETVTLDNIRHALIPIFYCGVLSTGLGYTFQTLGQRDCRPALAALILSLESVFCVIAGAILLGESMTARGYLGCALMLAAVCLAQVGSFKKNEV